MIVWTAQKKSDFRPTVWTKSYSCALLNFNLFETCLYTLCCFITFFMSQIWEVITFVIKKTSLSFQPVFVTSLNRLYRTSFHNYHALKIPRLNPKTVCWDVAKHRWVLLGGEGRWDWPPEQMWVNVWVYAFWADRVLWSSIHTQHSGKVSLLCECAGACVSCLNGEIVSRNICKDTGALLCVYAGVFSSSRNVWTPGHKCYSGALYQGSQ